MKISLGPIYYYWPRQNVIDFYQEMIQTPVDVIYLGETICAKRRELRSGDWLELAEQLCDSKPYAPSDANCAAGIGSSWPSSSVTPANKLLSLL